MKKQLLSFLSICTATALSAQWVDQATGFATASRGVNSINIVNTNTVWVGAYDGTNTSNYITDFSRTTNGGSLWMPGTVNTGLSGVGLANISAINGDTAWACIFHPTQAVAGGIWKTTDAGVTWTQQTSAAFTASGFPDIVYFWDANNGIAVGDPTGGYFEVYTTTDGGTTWTRTPNTGNQLSYSSASEYAYTNGYAVTGGTFWFGTTTGRVFKTTDKGLTFTKSTVGNGITDVQRITFADSLTGYAGMHNTGNKSYKIAKTTDGGTTWSLVATGTNVLGADFCAVPGTSALISVGSDAIINGSTWSNDAGLSWTAMEDTTIAPQRLSVRFMNASTGWAGGFNLDQTTGGISKFSGIVGIDNKGNLLRNITAFPNPASDVLNLRLDGFSGTVLNVEVFNLLGEKVSAERIVPGADIFFSRINISSLPGGIYFVKVSDGKNSFVNKFTRQ